MGKVGQSGGMKAPMQSKLVEHLVACYVDKSPQKQGFRGRALSWTVSAIW